MPGTVAHRYFRQILQGTLLPSIVHQPLPPSGDGVIGMRRAWCVDLMPGIVTREVKKTRRPMIGEHASLV